MLLRIALPLLFVVACASTRPPELRVIGVADAPRTDVVFVQVTNPAKRAMRLTKLQYKFAAGSATISQGELALHRDVPAGSAVVVELPLEVEPGGPVTLQGLLTAELGEMVRTFKVSAQITAGQGALVPEPS